MQKVLVALSGGVDSGVAAALLVQQGYEVTGVHLKLGSVEGSENKCCDVSSFGRVVALCEQLKIPLKVLDFSEKFANVVIHDFLDNYRRGLTPNPCVVCNKEVKIGGLVKWALENGFDYLATGHYCRVLNNKKQITNNKIGSDCFSLLQAIDKKKDQSYFLWTLKPAQIAHLLFPVGEMSKEEARNIAAKLKLPVAKARESFDVCFVGDRKTDDGSQKTDLRGQRTEVGEFLRKRLPAEAFRTGEVANVAGEVIGQHFGLPLYTIGQHRGFLVTGKKYGGQVLYVVRKDVVSNRLVVGKKEEAERSEFVICHLSFVIDLYWSDLAVRIRHQGKLLPVAGLKEDTGLLRVELKESVLGVAPGQSAVFYKGEELVGGGIICD